MILFHDLIMIWKFHIHLISNTVGRTWQKEN